MRNLKRALSLALASVMVLGMMVVGTSASYADVASTDNVEAIEVAKAAGIMVGDDKGNFNPDQKVTRNEMAVVMANLLGLKVANYEGTKLPFTDVPSWAKNYVAACYTNGIVSGTSATTYGGNDNVTAAQASLMVMKALGYFQNSGDFGDDWQLATVKQASKIDLTNGIDTAANAALTRNDVAQLVLNGLEADVVDFSGVYGTDIKTADGTTITVGYVSEYTASTDRNNYRYNGGTDTTLQLAEKLYKGDLKKTSTTDVFGRAANNWTYKNDDAGTYAKKADKVYVGGVKEKDLYKALNLVAATDDFALTVDGVPQPTKTVSSTLTTKIGGAGQVVEVYYDAQTPANNKIAVITSFVGEIDNVTKNSDDKRVVVISGMKFVTEKFEEEDVVVYTKDADAASDDRIQSVALAEKATGTIEKKVGTSDYYIDGTKYVVSTVYGDSVAVGDKVNFWTDANGYIVKMEKVDEAVNLDNLAFVEAAGSTRGNWATLRLADGTKMTVDTDKNYSALTGSDRFYAYNAAGVKGAQSVTDAQNYLVSFKETSNGYKLTQKSLYALSTNTTGVGHTFTKGNPELYVNRHTAAVPTNNSTVFVYWFGGSNYSTYTGYKNAPGLKAGETVGIAYYADGTKPATLVYIDCSRNGKASLASSAADMTFVAFDSDAKVINVKDVNAYYEYNAVVDGKITTIKVDAGSSLYTTVASAGTNVLSDWAGLTYDSDNLAYTGSAGSATTFTTAEAEKDGMIGLGGAWKAYADDVKVFIVNDEQEIRTGTINSIKKDNDGTKDGYVYGMYTVNSDSQVDLIIVVER